MPSYIDGKGYLVWWHQSLTHRQTLTDRATQLLKSRSGALLAQCKLYLLYIGCLWPQNTLGRRHSETNEYRICLRGVKQFDLRAQLLFSIIFIFVYSCLHLFFQSPHVFVLSLPLMFCSQQQKIQDFSSYSPLFTVDYIFFQSTRGLVLRPPWVDCSLWCFALKGKDISGMLKQNRKMTSYNFYDCPILLTR